MKAAVLLGFLLLLSIAAAVDLTYATALPEDDLWVSSQQTYPYPAEPGDKNVVLQLDLYHSGGRTYYNVSAEAQFSAPFTGVKTNYSLAKADPRNTYTVILSFDVAGNADPGVYAIPLKVSYVDSYSGGPYYRYTVKKVYVQVSVSSRLEISEITQSQAAVGGEFKINALIRNTGSMSAGNVSAIVLFSSQLVDAVPSTMQIANIAGRSSQAIEFRGRVSPYASNGGVSGNLTISYKGGTVTNAFVLNVNGAPFVELYGFKDTLASGGEGAVSFLVKNTGGSPLSDLRVSLNSSLQLAITDSVQYLGSLGPGESKQVEFAVRTDRSVKPGAYSGTVSLTYAEGSKTEAIGLLVTGKPVLQLAGSQTDVDPRQGMKFSLSIQLENTGTADARSVQVSLQGDLQGLKSSYVGTVDKDDTGTAVFDVFSPASGPLRIPITVRWADNEGNPYSHQETVELYVYPTDSSGYFGLMVFLLLAAAGYLLWRSRRHRELLKRVVG